MNIGMIGFLFLGFAVIATVVVLLIFINHQEKKQQK